MLCALVPIVGVIAVVVASVIYTWPEITEDQDE